MKRGFSQVYDAETAIPASHIVKHGSADGKAALATALGDPIMGVSDTQIDVAIGGRVDVIKGGIAPVKLGGTVSRGDPVSSNTFGLGVKAMPEAASNARIVGFAEVSGVSGDIIDVAISLGQIQG